MHIIIYIDSITHTQVFAYKYTLFHTWTTSEEITIVILSACGSWATCVSTFLFKGAFTVKMIATNFFSKSLLNGMEVHIND